MITKKILSICGLFILSMFILPLTVSANTSDCKVNPDWLTKPFLPDEVKKSGADGTSTFCDFYQFSTQAFLYLMSPVSKSDNKRNFQVQANYPILEYNGSGQPGNSCDTLIEGTTLRTHLAKTIGTGQAGGGATIYAQDGNVIYYDVRFNRDLCKQTASAVEMQKSNVINFPTKTMELKFAWKPLSKTEIADNTFVTQEQLISGKKVTLGLVGMHIARATKDHPEFVWATYEHKANTPDCLPSNIQDNTNWTFAGKSCTKNLPDSAAEKNTCKFNQPKSNLVSPTGKPTNICRVNPYGTASGDLKAGENITDITQQNTQLLKLLGKSGTAKSMKVLSNYFNVGAIWVSDIKQNSGGIGVPNERGSLRLANSVAETDYQHVNLTSSFASNCFGCHNYKGTSDQVSNNITSQSLSHIFRDIKVGQGEAIDITSPTIIGGNAEASSICAGIKGNKKKKGVCLNTASYLKWNGNWTNINTSAGSVCGCELAK